MKKIEIIKVEKGDHSSFIKFDNVHFRREGEDKEHIWCAIKKMSTVHVLAVDEEKQELILVEQVRIPVLLNEIDQSGTGVVLEACAGLMDKEGLTPKEIAQEELIEELGYNVYIDNIQLVRTVRSSVGTSGGYSHLFITFVDDSMKISEGGGLDDEDIEVVRIPFNKVRDIISNNSINTDSTTLFLLQNFLYISDL